MDNMTLNFFSFKPHNIAAHYALSCELLFCQSINLATVHLFHSFTTHYSCYFSTLQSSLMYRAVNFFFIFLDILDIDSLILNSQLAAL